MSGRDLIESELRTLANEGKRKTPPLREACEAAIAKVRSKSSVSYEDIQAAIEASKTSGQPKLIGMALSLVQKMVQFGYVDAISVMSVLTFLQSVVRDTNDESVQLKTLQTMMLILNPARVLLTEDLVDAVLDLSFKLQGVRSAVVRNTSSATVRQLIALSFDRLAQLYVSLPECKEEVKGHEHSFEAQSVYKSCAKAFKRIAFVIAGNEDHGLRLEALDLLLCILRASKGFLHKLDEFTSITDQLSKGRLLQILNENSDQQMTMKALGCAQIMIEISEEGMALVHPVLRLTESTQEWSVLASLEVLSVLFHSPAFISSLYNSGELYVQVLDGLNRLTARCLSDDRKRSKEECLRLITECLSHWVDAFGKLVEDSGLTLGYVANQPLTKPQNRISDMLKSAWRALLPILTQLVTRVQGEAFLQTTLNCFQSLIHISGTLNLSGAKESFLTTLAQFCVASEEGLNSRQILACKTLFNVAHCLGSVLDAKNWHRLLKTLYSLERTLENCTRNEEDVVSDLQILASAQESLFSNSQNLPDQSLVDLLSALGQLTLEYLENIATAERRNQGSRVFGLKKMGVVVKSNLDRAVLFWDMYVPYLDCICNSKYVEVRASGIEALQDFLVEAFPKFLANPPQEEKWLEWQQTMFLSLHDLCTSNYADTQQSVLKTVNAILQKCGGHLNRAGWGMLMLVLSKLNAKSHSEASFKCVKLIVNDFLQNDELMPSLDKLVACISSFAHSSEDLNQAISAVGMFWNVADYLGRVGRDEEELWWLVLQELRNLSEEPRPDVRHAAIRSLHVALTTHGACLSAETWKRVMQDVILHLLQRISACYFQHATHTNEVPIIEPPHFGNSHSTQSEAPSRGKRNLHIAIPTDTAFPLPKDTPKFAGVGDTYYKGDKIIVHHSRDTQEKQWEETYNVFTQNLGKLFRTYLVNIEKVTPESPAVQRHWSLLIIRLKEGIYNGTANIIIAVLKAVKELLNAPTVNRLFFTKWSSSWELFVTLANRLSVSSTPLPRKLVSVVLELLYMIYSSKNPDPVQPNSLHSLFMLINSMLNACMLDTAAVTMTKLTPEEREIFDFVEKLCDFMPDGEGLNAFCYFLIGFCKYDPNEPHSDALCRKALYILEMVASRLGSRAMNAVKESLLSRYQILMTLRFNGDASVVIAKGTDPLWVYAGDSFLKMAPYMMELDCWEKILEILESVINPSKAVLARVHASIMEEMVQQGELLDVKIARFMQTFMIPASMQLDESVQWKLVKLLDEGCSNYYRGYHKHDPSLQQSLASVCLAALLDLSRAREVAVEVTEETLQLKIARRTVPVLLDRCKDMISRFIVEERQSGMMPLPRSRQKEIAELLHNLRNLEIPEQVLNRQGPKQHLLELFPSLCELVTAKDIEIREELKELLIEVSKAFSKG
mmetsp:Transcript_32957/g.57855  ORF Transcript_32957/g.57855 Transcript_32957/m.57855 type:complete len:1408 (+) Transcript_32957:50-4273(+)